jgi:hypothetical protein
MKRRTLILAAPLSLLTLDVAADETPVKIVATLAVQGAFAEIEPLLQTRAGVPVRGMPTR